MVRFFVGQYCLRVKKKLQSVVPKGFLIVIVYEKHINVTLMTRSRDPKTEIEKLYVSHTQK